MSWLLFKTGVVRAGFWVRDNALWLLLFVIGAATGAKLLRRKDSEVSSLKDALTVERHKTAIEGLRARREEVLKADVASEARSKVLVSEATEIDQRITAHKRQVVAVHQKTVNIDSLTDEQVEELFRHAGL